MPAYLLTCGDSVHWGQGLLAAHKFSRTVATHLRATEPELVEHMLAHSGAIIGAGATVRRTLVNGEVPVAYPSIIEQLGWFPGAPEDVKAVLINGGINDIDIRTILNPFISLTTLKALTIEHCYDSMRVLLTHTLASFPSPTTRVVVTSYYPILSRRSTTFRIPRVLVIHGVQSQPPQLVSSHAFFDAIVGRCLQFWRESTDCLRRAVDEVNASLATPRVLFVDPGFTEDNAVFADDPWLWGLNQDLSPQDEVTDPRRGSCNAAIPWHDLLAREQCYRASAGHPNVTGARKYADAIIAALQVTV
jgi:hypothetical protein